MDPGTLYHVYNRGHNRDRIFLDNGHYRYFLSQLKHYTRDIIDIHAYCLMPNHFHLLLRSKDIPENHWPERGRPASVQALSNFLNSYVRSVNKSYDRVGSLFQGKLKKKVVDDPEYYMQLLLYIHRNPLEAQLARSLEDWPYSSYKPLLFGGEELLVRDEVLAKFGGKPEDFAAFHCTVMDMYEIRRWLQSGGGN